MSITVEHATINDLPNITRLFFETIQSVNAKDYPCDQIDDWSSWHKDTPKWAKRINDQYFLLGRIREEIVGFSSLAEDGYLDLMFVHKNYQRRGVAKALLTEILAQAKKQRNRRVYADVSITAKGFFEKYGFVVIKQQLKRSKEKELINFRMEIEISAPEIEQ